MTFFKPSAWCCAVALPLMWAVANPSVAATAQAKPITPAEQISLLRKNLTQRLNSVKTIDDIRATKIPGLFEVRVNGTELFYTDAKGDFLLDGSLWDTRQHRNLTEERVAKLTELKFDALPFKDAFTIVRGNGKRHVAMFEDPNCGYCKHFERELQKIDNVTVHLFLYPILGADSTEKSTHIWCAKDKGKTWQDWMLRDQLPTPATCDVASVVRNVELGRKYKISGTPTLIFANGTRVPGAINADEVERHLDGATL